MKRYNVAEGRYVSEFRGLSTDPKPIGKLNGSVFHEMDTGKKLMFDEKTMAWK